MAFSFSPKKEVKKVSLIYWEKEGERQSVVKRTGTLYGYFCCRVDSLIEKKRQSYDCCGSQKQQDQAVKTV